MKHLRHGGSEAPEELSMAIEFEPLDDEVSYYSSITGKVTYLN